MSQRNFARVFAAAIGQPPASWVQRARLEAARRLLESDTTSVKEVALTCGFRNVETMNRAFRRHLATTPLAYRQRFRVGDDPPYVRV